VASGATRVTDEMFFAAARTLADRVSDGDLKRGLVYPSLSRIREVSMFIAAAVAEVAYDNGLTDEDRPDNIVRHITSHMYEPRYRSFA
jgi:malate dehydrogenase (oxaloacetate-decarboxylating)(NADP+)